VPIHLTNKPILGFLQHHSSLDFMILGTILIYQFRLLWSLHTPTTRNTTNYLSALELAVKLSFTADIKYRAFRDHGAAFKRNGVPHWLLLLRQTKRKHMNMQMASIAINAMSYARDI